MYLQHIYSCFQMILVSMSFLKDVIKRYLNDVNIESLDWLNLSSNWSIPWRCDTNLKKLKTKRACLFLKSLFHDQIFLKELSIIFRFVYFQSCWTCLLLLLWTISNIWLEMLQSLVLIIYKNLLVIGLNLILKPRMLTILFFVYK